MNAEFHGKHFRYYHCLVIGIITITVGHEWPVGVPDMVGKAKLSINTLRHVQTGDVLLFNDHAEPVIAYEVETGLHDDRRHVTIEHRITCDGPRGGTVYLEELESGRIRALRNGCPEGRTVTEVGYVCEEHFDESQPTHDREKVGPVPP